MTIKVRLTLKGNQQHFGKPANAVVDIPLEDYIKGVVAAEVGSAPLEACKAQAVAARTFAYPSARDGKTITDTGATDQAFIAARMDNRGSYANAIQAVEETAGQVLTYNGRHIGKSAHYSSANNGTTKNRRYRWPNGTDEPFLVLRLDYWTYQELQRREAAGERIRYGHGVGMSQYGAMYAARQGIGYREILEFYYPGTDITQIDTTGSEAMTTTNTRAQHLIELARAEEGGAYVYAALGEKCTAANRMTYANRKPEHAEAIKRSCQILNGSKPGCAGCRYQGKRIFDCRGFTSYILKQATGRYLKGGGATSQWNDGSNWTDKGALDTLPDRPCVLFNKSKSKAGVMAHTGLYLGSDLVAQAGGYGGTGVHIGPLYPDKWTDWAIPVLLYDNEGGDAMALSRGSRGEAVRKLQSNLKMLNYTFKPTRTAPDGVDGIFGADTENTVKLFQANNGFETNGVWGAQEQAQLEELLGAEQPDAGDVVTITLPRKVAQVVAEALKEGGTL